MSGIFQVRGSFVRLAARTAKSAGIAAWQLAVPRQSGALRRLTPRLVSPGIAAVVGCTLAISPTLGDQPAARKLERDGLKLELAPLASDQVMAFFLARGFAKADAEHIATTGCVFRSAIGSGHRQADAPEVRVALPEWRVIPRGGDASPPRTREDWETVWRRRKVTGEAATAFYWALFPTEQSFGPTDYNWGFLTFGLPPAARFDLELRWSTQGKTQTARMEGLACGQ